MLLKPQSETGAQVVVQGRIHGTARAAAYQGMKADLLPFVLDSFARLKAEADLVLVEGAGSASEVNLRAADIANMGFARAAGVPVVLIGDIERGGVIASLVGTKAVIDPDDAALIAGFIVNRFRGDPALFASGMELIAAHTGWAPLGLVPHYAGAARLPAEDALALSAPPAPKPGARLRVCVPILPHVSNFDDLDPLDAEPGVEVRRIRPHECLPADADMVLLIGSKATIADLAALKSGGLHHDILAFARRGGRVLGLCGGYQMLGETVADPEGVEGEAKIARGLGLLKVHTVLAGEKRLEAVEGTACGAAFRGYEMHMGMTHGADAARPFARFPDGRTDGAHDAAGRIAGTYVHGLFSADTFRDAWLRSFGAGGAHAAYEDGVEAALDGLAAHLAAHVDLDRLLTLAR